MQGDLFSPLTILNSSVLRMRQGVDRKVGLLRETLACGGSVSKCKVIYFLHVPF